MAARSLSAFWHNGRSNTAVGGPLTVAGRVPGSAPAYPTRRVRRATDTRVRGVHHPPWPPRSSSCAWARCARRTTASSSPTPAPSATAASIETIGKYHPKEDPSFIEVDSERAQYWLGVGAQPTEAVAAIFRVTGDWQKFKGEPAPPPMKVAAPKPDKKALYEAAVRSAGGDEPAAGGHHRRRRRPRRRRPPLPRPRPRRPRLPRPPPPRPGRGPRPRGSAAGAPAETPAE